MINKFFKIHKDNKKDIKKYKKRQLFLFGYLSWFNIITTRDEGKDIVISVGAKEPLYTLNNYASTDAGYVLGAKIIIYKK